MKKKFQLLDLEHCVVDDDDGKEVRNNPMKGRNSGSLGYYNFGHRRMNLN